MSDAGGEPDVTELLADLTQELRRIQREVEPERRSLRRDLARFTSEVAIPALILVLKTNIQILELLRRTIRIAEGRELDHGQGGEMRERAERLGQATLSQLDTLLVELQSAVEGRPNDERARQLIDEARSLRQEIQDEFETDLDPETESVNIDVEAELRALKNDIDQPPSSGSDGDGSNKGNDDGSDDTSGGVDNPTDGS